MQIPKQRQILNTMNQDLKPEIPISSWPILIRKKALVLIAILAILLCLYKIVPTPLSKVFVQIGNAQFSAGNDKSAIASYNLALVFNGNLKKSIVQCVADMTQREYELAISDCSKVLEIDPNYAVAYFNRGLAYSMLGKYDQAISDYTSDIGLIPIATRSYINRGIVYMQLEKYNLAIADLTKSISINSKEPQAYLNRGLTYIKLGQYDLAISDCDKAIEIANNYWNAYYCLGLGYTGQENYEAAITNLTKAMELAPSTKTSIISNALENARQGIPTP
jgi:tetratricopeptide (TPR) repeat protein